MKRAYKAIVLSPLEKVFLDQPPVFRPECTDFTALRGETVSFQVAYTGEELWEFFVVRLESPVSAWMRVRSVESVPAALPAWQRDDDDFLRKEPGLFPDLLRDLPPDGTVAAIDGQWRAVWVDLCVDAETPAGRQPVEVVFTSENGEREFRAHTQIEVVDAQLPEQTLLHTEWFFADMLAEYYSVPAFSERHWEILENYIGHYGSRGMNMILTPVFTPPLEIFVGGDQMTVQLVDITKQDDDYSFGFERLRRFVTLCQKHGIEWFEINHLFSQWGSQSAPKVVADVMGGQQTIFGWHTPAVGGAYTVFLHRFVPELIAELKRLGIADRTVFHISDEPLPENLQNYLNAKNSVIDLLDGFTVIDALSHFSFYEQGIVKTPVVANDNMAPFLDAKVPELWTYHCCGQGIESANRFMAMPSRRNRILGTQLYKFGIKGFLQWGYNFYHSRESRYRIDPYSMTDAFSAFQAGDAFLVYPGANGYPEESIRMMSIYAACCDMRALQLLEEQIGREAVVAMIDEGLSMPVTFTMYPRSDMYLMGLRNRVNRMIAQHICS